MALHQTPGWVGGDAADGLAQQDTNHARSAYYGMMEVSLAERHDLQPRCCILLAEYHEQHTMRIHICTARRSTVSSCTQACSNGGLMSCHSTTATVMLQYPSDTDSHWK